MRDLVCGIAWPGDAPGFAAVLEVKGRAIYLKEEIEEPTLEKLIRECAPLRRENYFRGFVGRNEKAVMQFIWQWNRDRMNPFFQFYTAPHVNETGRFYYHLNILKSCLDPEHKSLFLFEGCKLAGYLKGLPITGLQDILDAQHPALAALAYGVAAIKQAQPDHEDYYDRGSYNNIDINSGRSRVTGY